MLPTRYNVSERFDPEVVLLASKHLTLPQVFVSSMTLTENTAEKTQHLNLFPQLFPSGSLNETNKPRLKML